MTRTLAALALALAAAAFAPTARAATVSESSYATLHWREIGPMRGGRTVAATGSPDNPNLFYMAPVNGGIWKSDDAGRTWMPIFNGQPTASIGAIAVAWSDPNVVYAGSGEGLQRPDLSIGDGIYKSADAGATWTNTGLRDAQQIGGMAVDPHDPNTVFVAALGHPYGPNTERGIYRTRDGGKTWERVLYKGEDVGGFAVTIDPHDSKTVYATLWAARQAPWEIGASFEIAGSGLFKSTDGGTTWTPLTQGLPDRVGRTEVAVAPSNPNVVYVYTDVEAKGGDSGTLYRSDDAGAHFTKVNDAANIAERGDDLVSLAVDPTDSNTVYETNTSTYKSTDGGKTMIAWRGAPGGDDYHNMWINPANPKVAIIGVDQGAIVTVNGGRSWSSWFNQPTAQMYHVSADDRFPYWVCGGQQESGSACVSSRGPWGEITTRDWHTVGAEEYGYVVPDPLHQGIFYGGKLERFDERTAQVQEVSPNPLRSKGYRVVRTEPIAFDHFDKHVMYFGSNVVWSTRDGGHSWKSISGDLTRERPAVPAVIEKFESDDPAGGKHRGVVYSLAPSYVHAGTIWAGTDDGLVWITRDGGAHWKNVTPPALTPWSKIAQIDASRADDETAYLAVNRFRLDDQHPYVYITHDGGTHWTLAVDGLRQAPVNAVREDPDRSNLLYAATERGVGVSFDGGAHWQSLQLNLPNTSVRDLIVHDGDVVVATHGRGFWILDDREPLLELASQGDYSQVHLFAPQRATRIRRSLNTDTPLQPDEPLLQNPPDGAIVDYYLPHPAKRVTIRIYAGSLPATPKPGVYDSTTIPMGAQFSSDDPAPPPIPDLDKPVWWEAPFERPGTDAGAHRFVWNLREAAPQTSGQDLPISAVPHRTPRVPEGILVVPGRYVVELDVDGVKQTRTLDVRMDPNVSMSQGQLAEQYRLARDIVFAMNETFKASMQATKAGKKADAERYDGLNGRLGVLLDVVDGVDAPPTTQAVGAFDDLVHAMVQDVPPGSPPHHDEP